jgi:hypothetical protein
VKKWIPIVSTVLAGVLAALTPQIQDWIAANPALAGLVGTVVAAVAHFFKPPTES